MKTIFILGNPIVAFDSTPITFLPKLKKDFSNYRFVFLDPTEEFPQGSNDTLILIDSIVGINHVAIFNSLTDFSSPPRFSAHDYDLYMQLSLMQKLKKIKSFIIIGIPALINKEKAYKKLTKLLSSISP